MILGTIFEMLGAITVGACTADTIKNGIIPLSAFRDNAGVQMLAFTCALAAASSWGRYKGKGLGAIFAGLGMAPVISAGFATIIIMLVKLVVHVRKNRVKWAVWSSPFFLIAGTICSLYIVYKGSPNPGLADKPAWYIASVTLGVGGSLFILSGIFFVPFVHAKVVKRGHSLKTWMVIYGPLLLKRPALSDTEQAKVPSYAVVQDAEDDGSLISSPSSINGKDSVEGKEANEKGLIVADAKQATYKELLAEGERKFHSRLYKKYLRITQRKDLKRIPAMVVVGALYGVNYDIMLFRLALRAPPAVNGRSVYMLTLRTCTASFAHGANDIGNSVGPWAVIYSAWNTGDAAFSKAEVPVWQLTFLSATIAFGLITYAYNIMKG
ncbi:putative sodium phosphate [Phaeomoniella chlamydospora]|uniref:Phosphate transporter n=1 Tax=Phaeomoniella chlamydospora TaxID=158046 RepID=A0A0G2FV49_PHACM|nr:putative sodium phosphate [Phaeomoniella chlamydospora]